MAKIIKVNCGQCGGKGEKKYSDGVTKGCTYCGGSGKVETIDQTKPSK